LGPYFCGIEKNVSITSLAASILFQEYLPDEETILDPDSEPLPNADKWVVITTIRSPTDAVRMLADQPGWKMVVVGDRKTPNAWR